ncbi:MAG: glucose-phosphate adenylyltransferase [Candidatus Sumerlaeota bacterium]|nr:glucose-phosphate adenylyltransferase [Candidatus Sumerlaeota bacterium]
MKNTLTVILGGGAGSRLFPLTMHRSKPAVPLAGKYRLIDVAISNAINSELRHIYVLTQYLSSSLNRHVSSTYNFDIFTNGFVEILAAEQRAEGGHWYQGTADALRQQWHTFDLPDYDLFLVLPGDALYHMDYRPLIRQHRETGADVTVAVNTVHRKAAHHFGLLALDDKGVISEFREKPKGAAMDGIEAPEAMLKKFGDRFDVGDTFLASMGVYVFTRKALDRYLRETEHMDFGKQIIPDAIKNLKCHGFIFPGYWEDIGTISAFFEAHMDLLKSPPPFSFNNPKWPIFTRPRFLPNVNALNCNLENCRVADGCILEGATLRTSIIGIRSHVRDHAVIEDSIIMGSDFYEPKCTHPSGVPLGIGKRAVIKHAIIDKNVRIGCGVKILNSEGLQEKDHELYTIRDGVVIIPKNTVIPDGMVI